MEASAPSSKEWAFPGGKEQRKGQNRQSFQVAGKNRQGATIPPIPSEQECVTAVEGRLEETPSWEILASF
jgi:hypothetical protein